jgi:hypothetical protein
MWDSGCNVTLFFSITVLKHGAKRFTSRHIEMIMLTQDEDSMNLVDFDNNNLLFIMVAEKGQKTW